MNEELKFIARPGFMVREIADEIMLVPLDTTGVYTGSNKMPLPEFNGIIQLNDIALYLWNLIQSPKSMNELIESIKSEFDTQGNDLESDIRDFLEIGIKNQIVFLIENKGGKNNDEKL